MAWTRRQPPPMQIYQDPGTFYDQPELYQIPDEYYPNPLKPLKNAAAPRKQSAVFDPPPLMPSAKSPCKVSMQTVPPPTAVFSSRFDKVTIPPPPSESFNTDSPKKKPAFSTFSTSVMQRPQKALFTTFPSARPNDKENQHPSQRVYSDNFAEFPDASFGQKAYQPGQRGRPPAKALLEAAPIRDKQAVKKGKGEEAATIHVPEPEEMPAVEDDGMKPPYSYATLIGMSILRASNRRLTLAQIYKWISDNFAYYRIAETGWQNSIRHNLSLNKAFVKQERPKDDPGKGNYWVIEVGMEGQFIKDKQVRRPASLTTAPSLPALAAPPPVMKERCQATTIHGHGHDHGHRHTGSTKSITMEKPKAPDFMPALSSDATLPASDPALQDDTSQDERDGFKAIEQKLHRAMKKSRTNSKHHFHIHTSGEDTSSPPQINSSPPIMHGIRGREATPPPPPQFSSMSSSHNHSRKRKSEGMDDSGYFSALQSSVHKRPRTAGALATSEADLDRPKSKRGRAEEEIARIRRSSHTSSPTKPRGGNILQSLSNSQLLSSSPIRHVVDTSLMLPPLTPATTFKLPRAAGTHLMPTISQAREASPNTNLRQHRDEIRKLVGSPERGPDLSAAFLAVDAGASSSSRFFDDSYFFDDCTLEVDDFGGDSLGGLGDDFPF